MFYALLIILVVTSLMTAMMSISYLSHKHLVGLINQGKVLHNLESGIKIALRNSEFAYNQQIHLDLWGEKLDSVTIYKEQWGLFDLVNVKSSRLRKSVNRSILVGTNTIADDSISLYVCDKYKPVVICGTTYIEGKCKLPLAGIKRGYVNGNHYLRDELIFGSYSQSARILPSLRRVLIEQSLATFQGELDINDSIVSYQSLERDSIHNNFENKSLTIIERNDLTLQNIQISGKVKLISEGNLTIDSTCRLEDVQIFAHNVKINEGFKGSAQIFVNGQIHLDSSIRLDYPSVLTVFNESAEEGDLITIGPKTSIYGTLLMLDLNSSEKNKTKIFMDERSSVHGVIYAQGLVELRNRVYGALYCEGLYHTTRRTRYDNHIFNGIISRKKLEHFYVFPELFDTPYFSRTIVKNL
jgi:hypothetical protein